MRSAAALYLFLTIFSGCNRGTALKSDKEAIRAYIESRMVKEWEKVGELTIVDRCRVEHTSGPGVIEDQIVDSELGAAQDERRTLTMIIRDDYVEFGRTIDSPSSDRRTQRPPETAKVPSGSQLVRVRVLVDPGSPNTIDQVAQRIGDFDHVLYTSSDVRRAIRDQIKSRDTLQVQEYDIFFAVDGQNEVLWHSPASFVDKYVAAVAK